MEEIDSIFEEAKKKKSTNVSPPKPTEATKDHVTTKRSFVECLNQSKRKKPKHNNPQRWMDDGLGGVYNEEGYTGRVEDGVRIFKAHVIARAESSGQSKDCPFDCRCCFI